MAAWPMLMPPSLTGIVGVGENVAPCLTQRRFDDFGESHVLEHASGEGDGVHVSGGGERRCQFAGGCAERLVEGGGEQGDRDASIDVGDEGGEQRDGIEDGDPSSLPDRTSPA